MNQRYKTERLIITAMHCNMPVLLYGNVIGSTLTFGYKFTSQPVALFSVVGTGTIDSVTYNKDSDGYYVSITLAYTGATSVNFFICGNAIVDEGT